MLAEDIESVAGVCRSPSMSANARWSARVAARGLGGRGMRVAPVWGRRSSAMNLTKPDRYQFLDQVVR